MWVFERKMWNLVCDLYKYTVQCIKYRVLYTVHQVVWNLQQLKYSFNPQRRSFFQRTATEMTNYFAVQWTAIILIVQLLRRSVVVHCTATSPNVLQLRKPLHCIVYSQFSKCTSTEMTYSIQLLFSLYCNWDYPGVLRH